MTTENLVKTPKTRVRRSSVDHGRNRLNVKGKDPAYVYRIVNNVDGRVEDMMDMGYEPDVSETTRVGDGRITDISKLGKVREISVGGGTKAVLMRQKREYYDEDQAAKEEYHKKTEQAMRPNPDEGGYGKVDITRK